MVMDSPVFIFSNRLLLATEIFPSSPTTPALTLICLGAEEVEENISSKAVSLAGASETGASTLGVTTATGSVLPQVFPPFMRYGVKSRSSKDILSGRLNMKISDSSSLMLIFSNP